NAANWLAHVPCASPTPTVTPTFTNTLTNTRTFTPTATLTPAATPTACGAGVNYVYTVSTGATIVPGTTDIGNHCDDCYTTVVLPFTYNIYGQPITQVNVSSNGNMQYQTGSVVYGNTCLPAASFFTTIFEYW